MSLVGFSAKNHPQQKTKPEVDDRGTDPALFAELHEQFGFTIDVAASAHNAKLPRYWDIHDDGLSRSWANLRVWCNPPYSSIRPWVEKAHIEVQAGLVVMLLPANRTEQGWWQDLIEPHRDNGGRLSVRFLRGRLRFVNAGKTEIGPNERPPFGCCLAIWK